MERLINYIKPPHRMTPEEYLASLDEPTRESVDDFVRFSHNLVTNTYDIAVLAVGSSTYPEIKRHHPVEDIDLRILNSKDTSSPFRESTVKTIQTQIHGYLETSNINFSSSESTASSYVFEGDVRYVDFYNSDPSFVTDPEEGLPLHLSVSGVHNPPLDSYLRREGGRGGLSVLLFDSRRSKINDELDLKELAERLRTTPLRSLASL